jgi:ABC-2 type transport system ATP-binding protein
MIFEAKNLTKKYPNGLVANDNISITLNAGEVFGLLGPNGAGKTTFVSQIIGLTAPTSGTMHIDGVDIIKNPAYARKVCSYQPQSHVPIDGLTPLQAIEIIGRLRGGDRKSVVNRASELVEKLQIQSWANKISDELSGGVRRLIAFCMAVVVPGKIVILDEPTNDVDPLRRRLLWDEVRNVANKGSTIILVTHNVLEAERSVDRLAIINASKLLKIGTPAAFKENDSDNLVLELILEPTAGISQLPEYITKKSSSGNRMRTTVKAGDLSRVVAWAQSMKTKGLIEEFFIGPINLEDAYMQMTSDYES